MWPWGHAAVAYLLYAAVTRGRDGERPGGPAVLALALGSQLPDLIDKPLAWEFAILPGGRTLGHSLFFAALLVLAVSFLVSRYDCRPLGFAFLCGYLSHLAADIPLSALLNGEFDDLSFLLWPVLEQPAYESVDGILAGFLRFSLSTNDRVQLVLFVVATLVWYRDGMPGLACLGTSLRRLVAGVR